MRVKKTVWHRLQVDGNHTHYYSKPHPPNTSNVGVSCGCGLILMIFIDYIPFRCYLPIIRFARETTNRVGMA